MIAYLNLKNDPELSKLKMIHGQLRETHYKTEENHHKNTLKSLKIDNDYYKKKFTNLDLKNFKYHSL